MQLKLNKLQKIVKNVISEEKHVNALKRELTATIGPVVVTEYGLKVMAESANDQLDVMLRTGRRPSTGSVGVLTKFMSSDEPEVRRLVARLLPESFVKKMMLDSDASVRLAAAERLSSCFIKEVLRRYPDDDQLHAVYQQKKIVEAGIALPRVVDDEFDIHGDGPLGDTARYDDHPGATDVAYDTLAYDFIKQYGLNMEGNWEEKSVKNYCHAMNSQGYDIDEEKFLKKIYDLLDQRNENMLKSTATKLRKSEDLDEAVMPILPETKDPVVVLFESKNHSDLYMRSFEKLFRVRRGEVDNPGRRFSINESYAKLVVPRSAELPSFILREVDEKALDHYVKCWNRRRQQLDQQYFLSWSILKENKIVFTVGLV